MRQPSLVIWTLNPVNGGTQLKLEHSDQTQQNQPMRLSGASFNHSINASLNLHQQTGQRTSFQLGSIDTNFEGNVLNFTLNAVWQAALNHRLQNLLKQELSVLESKQ